MDKKIIYVIVALILIVTSIGTVYVVMENKYKNVSIIENDDKPYDIYDSKDKEEPKPLEDSIVFVRRRKNGNAITETYKMIIDGKETSFDIDYTYETEENGEFILGRIESIPLFKKLNNTETAKDEFFTVENIKNLETEKNLFLIKSKEEKNYLAVVSNLEYKNDDLASYQYLYIFDDKLELIETADKEDKSIDANLNSQNERTSKGINPFLISSGELPNIIGVESNPWYNNSFNTCSGENTCRIKVKIEDNKIYYLTTTDFVNLEERVYTIENGQLNFEKINSYKITDIENLPF